MIGMNDFVVMIIVVIDFFQYCAMGPSFASLSQFVQSLANTLNIDLDELFDLSEGIYWIIFSFVFATCLLWLIIAVIIILRLDLRVENNECCQTFGVLSEIGLPIIGNACFLPITSILLDAFVCTESVGDKYTDSFLDRDCYVWCWEEEHIAYVVMSSICLVLYVPFAIYARPWWQLY
jgi:hypothetical protein